MLHEQEISIRPALGAEMSKRRVLYVLLLIAVVMGSAVFLWSGFSRYEEIEASQSYLASGTIRIAFGPHESDVKVVVTTYQALIGDPYSDSQQVLLSVYFTFNESRPYLLEMVTPDNITSVADYSLTFGGASQLISPNVTRGTESSYVSCGFIPDPAKMIKGVVNGGNIELRLNVSRLSFRRKLGQSDFFYSFWGNVSAPSERMFYGQDPVEVFPYPFEFHVVYPPTWLLTSSFPPPDSQYAIKGLRSAFWTLDFTHPFGHAQTVSVGLVSEADLQSRDKSILLSGILISSGIAGLMSTLFEIGGRLRDEYMSRRPSPPRLRRCRACGTEFFEIRMFEPCPSCRRRWSHR